MKALFALVIAGLFIVGCETGWIKASKMNKLSLGMTRPEVVRILGDPHSTEAKEGVEVLWYLEDQGGYRHQPYFAQFENGQLKSYGPGKMLNLTIEKK